MCGDDPSSKSEKPRSHIDNWRSTRGTERETCSAGKRRRGWEGGPKCLFERRTPGQANRSSAQLASQPAVLADGTLTDWRSRTRPSSPRSLSPRLPLRWEDDEIMKFFGQAGPVLMAGPGHSQLRLAGSGRSTDRWARVNRPHEPRQTSAGPVLSRPGIIPQLTEPGRAAGSWISPCPEA